MQLIARVYDLDIYESEIKQECRRLSNYRDDEYDQTALNSALAHLIDRMLLLHSAIENGLMVTETEYDSALMDILEAHDSEIKPSDDSGVNSFEAGKLEKLIKSRILIKKYLELISSQDIQVTEEDILRFYQEQQDVFLTHEEVRASHILIKNDDPDALNTIMQIREGIHTPEDFINICGSSSQCPTCYRCGDLGFFPRGKLIKEIEDVAFSLGINEISQPFLTKHGYHILMVTDKRRSNHIKFEDIKDSLRARLIHLEREFMIIRHITQLRNSGKEHIVILDPAYQS